MIQQQVREEADRLASELQLGALRQTYNSGKGGTLLATGISLLLAGFFLVALGLILLISLDPPAAIITSLLSTVFGVFIIVPGILSLRKRIRVRHAREFRYEHGLVMVDCYKDQLRASEAIHWREIVQIWHRVTRSTMVNGSQIYTSVSHTYRFQRQDGTYLGDRVRSIGSRSAAGSFGGEPGRRIEEGALPYLLPQAEASYQRGDPVQFGPITVTAEGIQYDGRTLPWQQVKQVYFKNEYGELVIKQQGEKWLSAPWAVIAYPDIPNLAVLNVLVQQLAVPVK